MRLCNTFDCFDVVVHVKKYKIYILSDATDAVTTDVVTLQPDYMSEQATLFDDDVSGACSVVLSVAL